jgi:hypothetical protein
VGAGARVGRVRLLLPTHAAMTTHLFSRLRAYGFKNEAREGGMDNDSDDSESDDEFSDFAATWTASSLSSFNSWTAGFPDSDYPPNAFMTSASPVVISFAALFMKVAPKNVPGLLDTVAVLAVHGVVVLCHSKVSAREIGLND